MTYVEAMERLAALGPEMQTIRVGSTVAPRKFSLEHIRAMLRELGQPQTQFPSVLIAGTNGKGSTAATLASIVHSAGIKTALYTSPHLVRVSERMRVSSLIGLEEIGEEAFARNYFRVDVAAQALVERGDLPHEPSYFEMMTAVAFCWFAEQGVELAVLEVGLGGRLDATNSVEPLVSVITDIGIDHTQYLGNTLREIAGEKAGILREGGVLVTLAQHPEANAAIGEAAVRLGVRGVDAARCLPAAQRTANSEQLKGQREGGSLLARNRYELSIEGEVLRVDSPLAGQHQQRNIALAIATAMELRANHGFVIPNAAIEAGIRATEWPGRLEWVSRAGRAPVLLDVAHNPAGAWALRAALAQLPESMPRTLIFSCLADKPIEEMAQVLLPLFDSASGDPARARDHVILAPIQNPRAASADDLLAAARKLDVPAEGVSDLPAALLLAEAVTPQDGLIVATGSVFLVGEIRSLLLAEREP
jgi:dihydrofolate synthase/folylpolyglutamate synthase